jgi:hypothetical protein
MTDAPEYLRTRDIARLTGASIRAARRWIAKRILVSGKLGGAQLVAKISPAPNLNQQGSSPGSAGEAAKV